MSVNNSVATKAARQAVYTVMRALCTSGVADLWRDYSASYLALEHYVAVPAAGDMQHFVHGPANSTLPHSQTQGMQPSVYTNFVC